MWMKSGSAPLTAPASIRSVSPLARRSQAIRIAYRDDAQAASMAKLGPPRPSASAATTAGRPTTRRFSSGAGAADGLDPANPSTEGPESPASTAPA